MNMSVYMVSRLSDILITGIVQYEKSEEKAISVDATNINMVVSNLQ